MSGLKTLLLVSATALALPCAPAHAESGDLRWFADCTGRLSAQMEHQWLLSDPGANMTERRRDAMWSLVEALAPDGMPARIMAWRIEAKAAQAALLSQATFAANPHTARRARARAEALIGSCASALLG